MNIFDWIFHVESNRRLRNLTAAHEYIICSMGRLISAGDDQPIDDAIAKATGFGVRTVRDARARARAIGLLTWEHTWRDTPEGRRQGPNLYKLALPEPAVARPNLRRQRPGGGVSRPKEVSMNQNLNMGLWITPESVDKSESRIATAWENRPRRDWTPPQSATPASEAVSERRIAEKWAARPQREWTKADLARARAGLTAPANAPDPRAGKTERQTNGGYGAVADKGLPGQPPKNGG